MNDPVDVLIIGAGASGAAVAWSLAETKMHILCLDQGGWMNPAAYPSTGRDWEARFFGDYSPSPNIRARPEDYPINDDNSPIKVVNFNGVGGSTVMYTAHCPRLHPSDFKVKTLDGVADDWPIDYDTLAPFFAENDRMMGVSGLSGDPAFPPTEPPMPPLPLGRSGARLAKAMNKLGWHWWPSDTTVATVDYEGSARCINLGHCTPTCLWSKQFYETDRSRGFVRGYAFQFGRGIGPVTEAVTSEAKGLLPWGAGHHAAFRRLNGHRLGVSAICEDLPEEHNRVTLDPVLKDSHGIPAPRIDYRIGENTARMMEHGIARAKQVLAAANATDI